MIRILLPVITLLIIAVSYKIFLAEKLTGPVRLGQNLESVDIKATTNQLKMISAVIEDEQDDKLTIRYKYQNNSEKVLYVCGQVDRIASYHFYCRPDALNKGNGEVLVTYGLSQSSSGIVCSKTVQAEIYEANKQPIYKHVFEFRKVWHKIPGIKSWYQYHKAGCPSRIN